jgi:Tol biopolymer transport system component
MQLDAGTRLGPYEVISSIGGGGVGEVYKARDTRLARDVAIKVLGSAFASDPVHRLRFEQEARAAGALNHPNIIAIYDIGVSGDTLYVVSEFLEGQTLRERLAQQRIPQHEAVEYAIQIAHGLAAAHQKGIVHRDLKPENIFLTKSGVVKILDFGLAKLAISRAPSEGMTQSPTRAMDTLPGLIVGTIGYMSPEQVRGQAIDPRSDIFSFGVILYEILACERAFSGDSAADAMSAILTSEPASLPDSVVLGLHLIVRRCLEKDPNRRFQTIQDVGFALEAMAGLGSRAAPELAPPSGPSPSRRAAVLGIAGFLIGALLAAALVFLLAPRHGSVSVKRVTFAQITDDAGEALYPSFDPGGKSVVYASNAAGNFDIYRHRFGDTEPVNLTKDSPAADTQPAVSPDGKLIAFRSDRDGGGIFVMDRDGSHVRRLSDFGYNPAWSPDGKELLCADESILRPDDRQLAVSRIWALDAATGNKRVVFAGDGVQPRWSPHGDRIVYWAIDRSGFRDIFTIPAEGGQPMSVTHDQHTDWSPVWSPDGKFIYFSSDRGDDMNVWRVPIQERTGKVLGLPEPVSAPSAYNGHLEFSRDGRQLTYAQQTFGAKIKMVRFDPMGETILSEPADAVPSMKEAFRPSLSPDGSWVAFNTAGKREDLFIAGTEGGTVRQLTDDGAKNRGPRFSPDGKRIAFFSKRSGSPEIWTIGIDGSNVQQVTSLNGPNIAWPVWSPNGKSLIYTVFGSGSFLIQLGLVPRQQPSALTPPDGSQFYAWSWSPDGAQIAGFQPRPDGSSSGIIVYTVGAGAYTRVTDFGGDPVWLTDSRRLLFVQGERIYLADTATKRTREILSVAPNQVAARGIDVSRDGRTIYFSVATTVADIWMMSFDSEN